MAGLSGIFEIIGDSVTGVAEVLGDVLTAVMNIFVTTTESGLDFTIIGKLTLISLASPLVFWGLNWISGLFKKVFKRG